jgi:hypothetical protein
LGRPHDSPARRRSTRGGTLVTAGKQLLSSLAIARRTLASVLLALPRRITKIARPSLYTLRHA